jgi:hypothetical protein
LPTFERPVSDSTHISSALGVGLLLAHADAVSIEKPKFATVSPTRRR